MRPGGYGTQSRPGGQHLDRFSALHRTAVRYAAKLIAAGMLILAPVAVVSRWTMTSLSAGRGSDMSAGPEHGMESGDACGPEAGGLLLGLVLAQVGESRDSPATVL